MPRENYAHNLYGPSVGETPKIEIGHISHSRNKTSTIVQFRGSAAKFLHGIEQGVQRLWLLS